MKTNLTIAILLTFTSSIYAQNNIDYGVKFGATSNKLRLNRNCDICEKPIYFPTLGVFASLRLNQKISLILEFQAMRLGSQQEFTGKKINNDSTYRFLEYMFIDKLSMPLTTSFQLFKYKNTKSSLIFGLSPNFFIRGKHLIKSYSSTQGNYTTEINPLKYGYDKTNYRVVTPMNRTSVQGILGFGISTSERINFNVVYRFSEEQSYVTIYPKERVLIGQKFQNNEFEINISYRISQRERNQ